MAAGALMRLIESHQKSNAACVSPRRSEKMMLRAYAFALPQEERIMMYRFHGIFVAIALALSAGISHAQDATGDLVPYVDTQLVGFTSTTVTGDAGVLGMTNACHLEFSATRMCTSEEVMNTVAMPVLPAETQAWVRPVFGPISSAIAGAMTIDHSGTVSSNNTSSVGTNASQGQSCRGWSSNSFGNIGLTASDEGGFSLLSCDVPRSVACCARIIVVPEPSASLQLGTGILGLAALSGRAVCGS